MVKKTTKKTTNKKDKTISEIKDYVKDLDKTVSKKVEKLDDESKEYGQQILEDTKYVINTAIEKINDAYNQIKNDERVDEFLDKVKAKAKEAVELAKSKIDDLQYYGAKKRPLDELYDDVMSGFDQLKKSDVYSKTQVVLEDISSRVREFIDKPEVQDTIKKVKTTTINLAEKGVAGLKKVLDTNKDKKEEDKED